MFHAIAATIFVTCTADPASPLTPELMIESAFQLRKQIRSLSLTVEVDSLGPRGERDRTLYRTWSRPDKYRIDMHDLNDDKGRRTVVCRNPTDKIGHIFYCEVSGDGADAKYHTTLQGIARSDYANHIFDPRLIGLVSTYTELLPHFNLEAECGRKDRGPLSERDDRIDDRNAKVVYFNFTTKRNPLMEYWLLPAANNALARVKFVDYFKDYDFTEVTDCHLSQYRDTQWWLPTSTKYRRLKNNNEDAGEVTQIQYHSVNEPIPDEVFTLRSIGLPDGLTIYSQGESGKAYVVKNGKLTERSARADNRPVLPTQCFAPQPVGQRSYLIYGLIGFALAAILSLVFFSAPAPGRSHETNALTRCWNCSWSSASFRRWRSRRSCGCEPPPSGSRLRDERLPISE